MNAACRECGANLDRDEAFCGECGEAIEGIEGIEGVKPARKKKPRGSIADKHRKKTYRGNISGGRKAILAVAVIQVIFGTFAVVRLNSMGIDSSLVTATAIEVYGVAALFFGMFAWSLKAPFPASVTALVVYLALHLVYAALNPATLASGILLKAIVIICLVKAVKSAAAFRKMQEREAIA
jgi:hypothetical protein